MPDLTIDFSPIRRLTEGSQPSSPLLRRCLSFQPQLTAEQEVPDFFVPVDRPEDQKNLESLRPKAAASLATLDLQNALGTAESEPETVPILTFCAALMTWGSLQRKLGQQGEAAHVVLAQHGLARVD